MRSGVGGMSLIQTTLAHRERPEDWPEYEFARATVRCSLCAWNRHLYGEEAAPDECPSCEGRGPEWLAVLEAMGKRQWRATCDANRTALRQLWQIGRAEP
jgi:hypothetical protein